MIYIYILLSGLRLVGHVIGTSITDEFNCGLLCARNIKCHSYNSHSDGQHSNKICELSDQSRQAKPKDLIPSKGFSYYEKSKKVITVN